MIARDNPYVAWMRDRCGEPTPTEEVVAGQLPALAEALRAAAVRTGVWLVAERRARRRPAPGPTAGDGPGAAEPAAPCETAPVAPVEPARETPGEAPAEASAEPRGEPGPQESPPAPDPHADLVRRALLHGACRELDRLASSPGRAAFLEAALAYELEHDSARALEPPPEAPAGRAEAARSLEAGVAARDGVEAATLEGLGERVVERGAGAARSVLYGEGADESDASLPRAGFWRRAGGFVLDHALLSFAGTIAVVLAANLAGVIDETALFAVRMLAMFAGLLVGIPMLVRWGATPGRIALGTEVREVTGGARPRAGLALLRQALGEWLNLLFCGGGFWWSLASEGHRTWADVVSSTHVVHLPRPLPLRRPVMLALLGVAVAQLLVGAELVRQGTASSRLPGSADTLFSEAGVFADSMQLFATRKVESEAAFRSDLGRLAVAAARYDSLLGLQKRHARVYRQALLVGPGLRRTWARIDSLIDLRLERSRLLQRWAADALAGGYVDSLVPPAVRRRLRYEVSDLHAVERRIGALSERIHAEDTP